MALPEINKDQAIGLIETGAGYWSPQCHAPTPGTTNTTVVYLCGKFYVFPNEVFRVRVHKVMHFEQSSMIVAHAVECHDDELGQLIGVEMKRIAEQTARERWAQGFLSILDDHVRQKTAVTPRQGRQWYNRFIMEPVDRGSPPDIN